MLQRNSNLKKNRTVKYKLAQIFLYMFFEGSKILWKFEFFRDPEWYYNCPYRNSRTRKGGRRSWRWRGSKIEFQGRRSRRREGKMLTMGKWCNQSATSCTMCKRVWVGIRHERFENSDSVLGRHPGLFNLDCSSKGGRRSPTP